MTSSGEIRQTKDMDRSPCSMAEQRAKEGDLQGHDTNIEAHHIVMMALEYINLESEETRTKKEKKEKPSRLWELAKRMTNYEIEGPEPQAQPPTQNAKETCQNKSLWDRIEASIDVTAART